MKTMMCCLAVFALAVFTSATFAQDPAPASQGPTLTSVQVKFDTSRNNKNSDSKLDVYIKTNHGHEIAKSEGNSGGWGDNSTHTLNLEVEGVRTKDELADGSVSLIFHPRGSDKWEFGYKVTLKFSDDSSIIKEFADCELTQHRANRTDSL